MNDELAARLIEELSNIRGELRHMRNEARDNARRMAWPQYVKLIIGGGVLLLAFLVYLLAIMDTT